jgi:glycosyltransferase involved in cell wall biosynthesis
VTTTAPLPVSVVIPAYNAARFIEEALSSVHAQTRRPAEIIVVNDGSTDDTAARARTNGAVVVTQRNQGLSATRNAGIRAASQPWIALLDADDVWEPRKLEQQWTAATLCPDAGVIFTDVTRFSAQGVVDPSILGRAKHYAEVRRIQVADGIVRCERGSLQQAFVKENFFSPSAVMARRDLLLAAGLFDLVITHWEDRDMWLRLLALTDVAVVEQPLMRYRVHTSGLSNDDRGMARGAIAIAHKVLANPAQYFPHAVDRYRADLPGLYLIAGRLEEQSGNIPLARAYYISSWKSRRRVRPLALAVLSTMPKPVRGAARHVVSGFATLREWLARMLTAPDHRERRA